MEGTNDALTLAFGTLEHKERIKGMVAEVTPTTNFHTPTPYRRPKQVGGQKKLDEV